MNLHRKVLAGVFVAGCAGLGLLILTTARQKPFDFRFLGNQEPIRVIKEPGHKRYIYSFPAPFFDLRKSAEKEMKERGFQTISRPEDTGRWWEKEPVSVMLNAPHSFIQSGEVKESDGHWKWVTVDIFDDREPGWLEKLWDRFRR